VNHGNEGFEMETMQRVLEDSKTPETLSEGQITLFQNTTRPPCTECGLSMNGERKNAIVHRQCAPIRDKRIRFERKYVKAFERFQEARQTLDSNPELREHILEKARTSIITGEPILTRYTFEEFRKTYRTKLDNTLFRAILLILEEENPEIKGVFKHRGSNEIYT
jgi:hypothetical protein